MTEQIINEMYLLAAKSKLQRGAISVEDRLNYILSEFNLHAGETVNIEEPSVSTPYIEHPQANAVQQHAEPVSSKHSEPKVTGHKYAEQPEDDGFINRELESEKELRHIYDIHITDDPSVAYYELITDSGRCAEYLRSPSMVPEYVVAFENTPTGQEPQLEKVKLGVLKRSGTIWRIVEPCRMKWC